MAIYGEMVNRTPWSIGSHTSVLKKRSKIFFSTLSHEYERRWVVYRRSTKADAELIAMVAPTINSSATYSKLLGTDR